MKTRTFLKALVLGVSLVTASLAQAQVSTSTVKPTLSYQAHLHTAMDGKPVEGVVNARIVLYADEAGTTPLWSDNFTTKAEGGVLSFELGSNVELPSQEILDKVAFIGVSINGLSEMRPLTRVSAVPRAMTVTDGAITSAKLAEGSVTADKIEASYIAEVNVNGKRITGNGATLNIMSGNGVKAEYNEALDALILSASKTIGFVAVDACGTTNSDGGINQNTVSGGCNNTANASNGYATIGGGTGNTASGDFSTIGGGNANTATVDYATVAGGTDNNATNTGATVGGGGFNDVSGEYATIAGGTDHDISSNYATVGGGGNNNVLTSSTYSTIGGGKDNEISDDWATIAGGNTNKAKAQYSTVGGGRENEAWGTNASVSGGYGNKTTSSGATGENSTISGGRANEINGKLSAIAGGGFLRISDRSFGFNSSAGPSLLDLSATDDIAYFGNVDLWLGNSNSGTAKSMRFYEDNSSATALSANYTALKAASSMSADVTYTLPSAAPSVSGQVLSSTTGGTMSWLADPVTGTGAATRVAFWNGTSTLSSDADMYYDNTNDRLGLGTTSPTSTLHVTKSISGSGAADGVTIAQSLTSSGGGTLKGLYVNPTFSTSGDKFAIEAAGNVRISPNSSTESQLQFKNVAGTVTGFKSHVSSSATTYTLPVAAPGSDKYLKSDASGNLTWDTPAGGGGGSSWSLSGNASTTPGTDFLGTTDNNALEIHVNTAGSSSGGYDRVMRFEPKTNSANIIGGHNTNSVSAAEGVTIAGGGANGSANSVAGDYASVGGGSAHAISAAGDYAAIPGGLGLSAQSRSVAIVGQYNDPYGTYSGGAVLPTNTDPLFLVGNGSSSGAKSNAFSVSVSGHARAYQRIGDLGASPVTNGIYEDNQIVAWGIVDAGGNVEHDFGVVSAVWGGAFPTNWCVITLSNAPGLADNISSVTANITENCMWGGGFLPGFCTVVEGGATLGECNGTYGSLADNQIAVITYGVNNVDSSPGAVYSAEDMVTIERARLPFNFKVTGRSTSIPR